MNCSFPYFLYVELNYWMYSMIKLESYVIWPDSTSIRFLNWSHCELFVQLYFRNCNPNFGVFLWG
jgi:hypothetical protein